MASAICARVCSSACAVALEPGRSGAYCTQWPSAHKSRRTYQCQHCLLHEFRNRHVARLRQTAAVSLDAFYLVERFSRQIARATMGATDNRNIFDHQKARTLAVASRHVPEMNSVPTAVLATSPSFSRVTLHRRSKYTAGGPART